MHSSAFVEHVFQVLINIQMIMFSCFNNAEQNAASLGTFFRVVKQAVFSVYNIRFHRSFSHLSAYENNVLYAHDIFILIL